MAIKIEMMRCFSTVAQTGNLSEAADQLSRTQSALSMTLKQFEAQIGHRLFESDRKNRLTPLGEQVFELAQEQLRLFDNTVNAIKNAANHPRGLIRIASIPSVSSLVFPLAIKKLAQRYPGLKVELHDTDTQRVIDALVQGHADFGIVSGQQSLNGIRRVLLFEDQFGLICSPDHPLATQAQSPVISDLKSKDFVSNNLCNIIESAEFKAAVSQANVSVHNTLSLIGMIRTQNWITVLPQQVTQLLPNDLTFRKIDSLDDKRPVFALVRERSPYLRYAEELAEIVCDLIDSAAVSYDS